MCVVIAKEGGLALCATEAGDASDVMVDLVDGVAPGDQLLVHAGVALTRLG
jgi:hydrogenase maturation factor